MHYSYFLVKPDGIKFLKPICKQIEDKYESVRYYAVEDFEKLIRDLYYKHFEEKGINFENSFGAYLYGLRETYGNESVLILVGDNMEYDKLVQSVYDTKMDIRNKYTNNDVGVVTNYGNRKEYIRFVSEDGEERPPRIMNKLGSYRISNMNIIHSPDADEKTTLEELNILMKDGIIDDKNLITLDMIEKMEKYQTATLQRDMREPGYQGEVKPDISGWVRQQINSEKDIGNR